MNTLSAEEKSEIWVPSLEFRYKSLSFTLMNDFYLHSNTEQKSITLNDDKAFALAEREGDFKYTDEKEKDNKYEFEGSQNKITLSRIYDTDWICDYHMGFVNI